MDRPRPRVLIAMANPPMPAVVPAFEAAKKYASGGVQFKRWIDASEWEEAVIRAHGRAQISPEGELELWKTFEPVCKQLAAKSKFSKDGVANSWERMRRISLLGMLAVVDFRSQDYAIREIFQRCFGQMSLAWMMESCKTDAPPWYYKWAYDAIPETSGKAWGARAFECIAGSEEHMKVFQEINAKKANLLIVKKVMES